MTANQINYAKHREDVRTHQVQEQEAYRHNVAYENEMNRGNTLNYQSSIYSSQVSARNAEIAADTQRYAAALNYSANVHAADVNAETMRRGQTLTNIVQTQEALTHMDSLAETRRHNKEMENIQQQQTTTGKWNAGANILNAISSVAGRVTSLLPIKS